MKKFWIYCEVFFILKFFHANRTIIFALPKPFINTIVVKGMNAGKHTAKITITQSFLTDGACFWDERHILKVDKVCLN